MKFVTKSKLELSDVLLPDLFIVNNMNSLELVDLKVYIYILYLSKNGEEIETVSLAKKLNLTLIDITHHYSEIPGLYVLFATLEEKLAGRKKMKIKVKNMKMKVASEEV